MDPVSYLFSAYLNLVQQQVSDIYGTEPKSLVVEYEGEQIPFVFQFWQLQPKSVCRSYEQDARRFSQCTVKAAALFGRLCDELSRQDSNWQQPQYRAMYCAASVNYRPMIADIRESKQDPARQAERACNQAILAAMDSDDETLLAQREQACSAQR
ncbi:MULTISPECIES: hypothetical protein [Aeromonas]|jgi:hypothetical protein|uniref:Uncharacterized protein n=1 Tax=Aeromonas piscicola TaxID=600645 RepID=A0ABT7Q7C7_9GAMM|nr:MULTISPECIES: hypothetical protein [Aeromonas]MCW0503646.1 hypothetical protein [Aeromonas piscicola]MDM5129832.1 hypothetical protein [Aeromonas piscicola]RSM33642.1 hypothetical protein C5B77_02195 [Aeromonas salmonicida]